MKHIFYLILTALLFIQCSKKTTESAMSKTNEVKGEVKENVADAKSAMADVQEAFRANPPEAAAARKIQLGEFDQFTLTNGLTVIVVENHKLPRVSYQVRLKNEAVQEGDKAGYVSVTGQLLSRGTTSMNKEEIDESVDFIGGSFNTSGYGLFASSLTKHQDDLLTTVKDVLLYPSFPEDEFKKIITQTLSGLEQQKTDPGSIASNVANRVNFGAEHPFGEVQTVESTEKITLEDCKQYYDTYFTPSNAFLMIVGDITPAAAKENAEKYFGSWQGKPVKQMKFDNSLNPRGTQVAFANKEGAVQSSIRVTYPVELKQGDPDVIPVSLMNSILGGGGFSSRLFQNLREDKGYTYGANSRLSVSPIIGRFTASADVRNEVTDSSIVEFLLEMERIASEPVDAQDLTNMKNYRTGVFALQLESPQTIARYAYNIARYNLPADYYETYLEKLNAVTSEDIQRVARKYITPMNANIVVVGNKDDVAESIARFDSDGEIEFYDFKGDQIVMKASNLPMTLTAQDVINDYIEAIGGKDALAKIKSVKTTAGMSAMGQDMDVTTYQDMSGKFAMNMATQGMTVVDQKYDGVKMEMSQMGQKQLITEGPQLEDAKESAMIAPQLQYEEPGYKLDLKGSEDLNGKNVYKIVVTNPKGKKVTQYYDSASSLLVKNVSSVGEQTLTQEMDDYREVSGVKFPYSMKLIGAAPVPMEMEVKDVEVNGAIDASVFTIKD